MALINCPKCGASISEQASVCPQCKETVSKADSIICEECKTKYSSDLASCPQCGHPTPRDNKKKSKKSRKTLALVLLLVVVIAGIFTYQAHQETIYYNNMVDLANTMIDGAQKAENAGNTIVGVWNNAIWQTRNDKTDKYTMANGRFVDDFNVALDSLFADEEFMQSLSDIQNQQAEATDLMKKMKNPPDKYAEAAAALKECYDNYIKFIGCVIDPRGSLNSFSEDFGKYDEAVADSLQKLELYFD